MGARRALTFLERQPQVDPNRLGVYGHSMGGKLTVMTTGADSRVKAAAPSCGGMSDLQGKDPIYQATICDDNYLKRITCPILFLSPSNDFHGTIDDLQSAIRHIKSKEWRITCSPHHNHQDTNEYEVATLLWFDQYLKKEFKFAETPKSTLILKSKNKIPQFIVQPDNSQEILAVDIYYTQQGQIDGKRDDMTNTKKRFWHHAKAEKKNGVWSAPLPIFSTEKPLWVYANVLYPLKKPVTGTGYYYGVFTSDKVNLSSEMAMVTPEDLKKNNILATLEPQNIIENFTDNWQKEWFNYRPSQWQIKTHKLYHPRWAAPVNAKLSLEVKSVEANKFIVGLDNYAAEIQLQGNNQWQTIVLTPKNFKNALDSQKADWQNLKELRLGYLDTLRERAQNKVKTLGAPWNGPKPEFRNLRWIK